MQVTETEKRAVSLGSTGRGFLSEGQAAAELFFRLNHARQTVTYVRNQVSKLFPVAGLACFLSTAILKPATLGKRCNIRPLSAPLPVPCFL